MQVLLLNGPNLDMLGRRETNIYGSETLDDILAPARALATELGVELDTRQSSYEGQLISWINDTTARGVIINAGGLSHTSVALRDSLAAYSGVAVEVHISNIHAREKFRHRALTAGACDGVIAGLGGHGYACALRYIVSRLNAR